MYKITWGGGGNQTLDILTSKLTKSSNLVDMHIFKQF